MPPQVIDSVNAHTKEVTCLATNFGARNDVFTGSIDGRLVKTEEENGALHVHNTVDRAFGDGSGGAAIAIVSIKLGSAVGAVVVQGAGAMWGVWGIKTFKRILVFLEPAPVMAFEVLGCSGDAEEAREEEAAAAGAGPKKSYMEIASLLTVAVAVAVGIRVYSLDINEAHGCCTHVLQVRPQPQP